MVFTYGTQFMYDCGPLEHRYGANYFMDQDVILVTFHYRLGSLGRTIKILKHHDGIFSPDGNHLSVPRVRGTSK